MTVMKPPCFGEHAMVARVTEASKERWQYPDEPCWIPFHGKDAGGAIPFEGVFCVRCGITPAKEAVRE